MLLIIIIKMKNAWMFKSVKAHVFKDTVHQMK